MRPLAVLLGTWAAVVSGQRRSGLRVRRAADRRSEAICNLARSLANSRGLAEVFAAVEHGFLITFGVPVAVVVPGRNNDYARLCSGRFAFDEQDMRTAVAALRSGRCAGYGTPEFATARSRFVPLRTSGGIVGALGFKPDKRSATTLDSGSVCLEAFIDQTALAVLRAGLEDRAMHAAALEDSDNLQKALLSSISHNVRTPLASVLGALGMLQDQYDTLSDAMARDLIDNARSEAERLNRLLVNLLGMSRLEAGALSVRLDLCDVDDVIGAALEQLGSAVASRPIKVSLAPDLPFVRMDFVLIVQVVVNLLDNALKYSPENEPVVVEAFVLDERLEIRVIDNGDGIPDEHLPRIFEKFYRAGRTGETGGVGLGLSICKGLIEAHHGRIRAERREPHGTSVIFSLPIGPVPFGDRK